MDYESYMPNAANGRETRAQVSSSSCANDDPLDQS